MNSYEIWAAAQLLPQEPPEAGIARVDALIKHTVEDAVRFQAMMDLMQSAFEDTDSEFEDDSLHIVCEEVSEFKNGRTIRAEFIWDEYQDDDDSDDLKFHIVLDSFKNT